MGDHLRVIIVEESDCIRSNDNFYLMGMDNRYVER